MAICFIGNVHGDICSASKAKKLSCQVMFSLFEHAFYIHKPIYGSKSNVKDLRSSTPFPHKSKPKTILQKYKFISA